MTSLCRPQAWGDKIGTSNLFWLNPTAGHWASEFLNIISEGRDWGVKEQSGPGGTN